MRNQLWKAKWLIAALLFLLLIGFVSLWYRREGRISNPGGCARDGLPLNRMNEPLPRLAGRAVGPRTSVIGHADRGASARIPITLRGHVYDEQDRPISNAFVYVLADSWRGALSFTDVPSAASDEGGLFSLRVTTLSRSCLGAIAEGFLPAYADADAINPDAPLDFHLSAGPVQEVRTPPQEDVTSIETGVSICSASDRVSWVVPGDGDLPHVSMYRAMPPTGHLRVAVGTRGAIDVRASRHGYVSIPAVVHLRFPGEQVVAFGFVPSCGVRIRVTDERGAPITQKIRYDLYEPDTARIVNGSTFHSPYGESELADRIPSGPYDLHVESDGYEPIVQRVELSVPGKEYDFTIVLEENRTRVRLRLAFPDLLQSAALAGQLDWHSPILLMRDHDGGTWEQLWDLTWNPETAVVELWVEPGPLPPLVVLFPRFDRVALVRLGDVAAGQTIDFSIRLQSGLYWQLPPLESEAGTLVHLSIEAADGRVTTLQAWSVQRSDLRTYARADSLPGPLRLGPYPGDHITARLVYGSGRVIEQVVRRNQVSGPNGGG